MYVYQQELGDHTQRGIVCVCHIEDYENNIIKKTFVTIIHRQIKAIYPINKTDFKIELKL